MKALQVWLDKVQDKEKVGQWYAVLELNKLWRGIVIIFVALVCGVSAVGQVVPLSVLSNCVTVQVMIGIGCLQSCSVFTAYRDFGTL